jgi:hypothetical protein
MLYQQQNGFYDSLSGKTILDISLKFFRKNIKNET